MTFRVPLLVKLAALVAVSTGFYTYVGQMVPQKEVYPPKDIELKADMSTAEMAKVGKELMEGKGLCFTCHTVGKKGPLRFPDLEGIDGRAATREPGLNDVEYFAKSMYAPDSYVVPGFNPGMPVINKPPIGLSDQEILCVIAYLQTFGGTSTVTLQTKHHYNGGSGTAAQAGAPGAAPAAAADTAAPAAASASKP